MGDRRAFLQQSLGFAALAGWAPAALGQAEQVTPPSLPSPDLYLKNEDAYWAEIRKQFIIPADHIYLNNGTVGSNPLPVLKAVFDSYFDCEKLSWDDPERYPIWGYEPWNEYRDPLAQFVGASRDELALVRNATEGNSFMANGLDMKPGDEVLISNQEHPSGEGPWNLRAKRYGIVVKRFEIAKPTDDAAAILNKINDAITSRTKVIFVSHITTDTGIILPIKEMASLAHSKGVISMVDGAHVPGMMPLNIKELGCDMYSASPHKWLQAPKGTGFLFIRDELIDRVWSTTTTAGWDDPKLRMERFQRFGSSNLPLLVGLKASLDFANQIGMNRIVKRHRELNRYITAEMNERGLTMWTSNNADMRCAISSFNMPPINIYDLERSLWKEHKIRVRGGGPNKIRLSTPYYLQKAEIDRFLERFDEFRKTYKA